MSGISWSVLAGLMRALSIFAPLGGKHGEELQKLLNVVAALLERGEAGRHALEALAAKVDEMVAQGREPSAEEWAVLLARSNTAHEAIQAAAAEPAPETPSGDSEGGTAD